MRARRSFHTVIVGGGTAGCVLASHLSAHPGRTVALVEAGPDFGPADGGSWPPELASAAFTATSYDWGDTARVVDYRIPYARGKVIGGSSAVNAVGINWGLRQDYDRWLTGGNTGWGFDDLVPFLQRVERLENDAPPLRGRAGALIVRRTRSDSPFLADRGRSLAAAGLQTADDVSGPDTLEGFGFPTRNVRAGVRFHAAAAYFDPIRRRPNLTIMDRTVADRIEWEGGRAHGLHVVAGDRRLFIEAEQIVLSAGTVGSLQRSGVGPSDLLGPALGSTATLHELPGVGRNLQDHYGTPMVYRVTRDFYDRFGVDERPAEAPTAQMNVRLKSCPELQAFDLDILVAHATDRPQARDDEVVRILVFLVQPAARGYVAIRSADPTVAPVIETGFGVSEDVEAISRGVEWSRQRMRDTAIAGWIDAELVPGSEIRTAGLRGWAQSNLASYHHPVGTCKLGPPSDPLAVVDNDGRVHGFDNLYVADASIMPSIPHGQLNLTVYAVGERIGQALATA